MGPKIEFAMCPFATLVLRRPQPVLAHALSVHLVFGAFGGKEQRRAGERARASFPKADDGRRHAREMFPLSAPLSGATADRSLSLLALNGLTPLTAAPVSRMQNATFTLKGGSEIERHSSKMFQPVEASSVSL